MIYIFLVLSLVFITVGLSVKVKNDTCTVLGKQISTSEFNSQDDTVKYASYFKNFHIILALSYFSIGALLIHFVDSQAAGLLLVVYPIGAYIFFLIKIQNFTKNTNKKKINIASLLLLATFLIVIFTFLEGNKETNIILQPNAIILEGSYGEVLPITEL